MYRCKLFVDAVVCDNSNAMFYISKIPQNGLIVENCGNKYNVTSINESSLILNESTADEITVTVYELTGVIVV